MKIKNYQISNNNNFFFTKGVNEIHLSIADCILLYCFNTNESLDTGNVFSHFVVNAI